MPTPHVSWTELFDTHLIEHKLVFDSVLFLRSEVEGVAKVLAECLAQQKKILMCGNGGSASDAQHFAAELAGRFCRNREPLAAMALSANAAVLTCIGNDFGFEEIYARQVYALGQEGDCFLGISTSGNSANVLRAVEAAKQRKMITIALTGEGGQLNQVCDHVIAVPSSSTARIQEAHIFVIHALCTLVESTLGVDA